MRYADDLLLLCQSWAEAMSAHEALVELLCSAGMPVKGDVRSAARALSPGRPAFWLGFRIRKGVARLQAALDERAWYRLEEGLFLAHEHDDAPLRALGVIRGWINSKGPCYETVDHDEACDRIAGLANAQAFDEILTSEDVHGCWQCAHARWKKLRKAAAAAPLSSKRMDARNRQRCT